MFPLSDSVYVGTFQDKMHILSTSVFERTKTWLQAKDIWQGFFEQCMTNCRFIDQTSKEILE